MEAQVFLTVAFSSSAFAGTSCFSFFLLTIPHRLSMGFGSGEFAGPVKHTNTMVM